MSCRYQVPTQSNAIIQNIPLYGRSKSLSNIVVLNGGYDAAGTIDLDTETYNIWPMQYKNSYMKLSIVACYMKSVTFKSCWLPREKEEDKSYPDHPSMRILTQAI